MVILKEKKSKINLENTRRITIDAQHELKIKKFKKNKKNLKKLESELLTFEKNYLKYLNIPSNNLSEIDLENKLTLKEKINELKNKIQLTKNDSELNNYLLNTSNILYQYYDDPITVKHKLNNKRRKTVVDFFNKIPKKSEKKIINKESIKIYTKNELINNYLKLTDSNYVKILENTNINYCKNCNCENIFNNSEGVYICPQCGEQKKLLIDSDKPSYKDPPREISYFAYKRINHFNEWLAQFQAKESTDIPQNIYTKIKLELNKESYLDIKNLKVKKIRDILKKLKLNKYYEHVPHIINRLSGNPAPIITRDLEEKLRIMFKEIQNPWMRHCPDKRSNFLSYSYVLFKCLQLLEMDKFLKHFSLLKSREKLAEQDKIWKKICNDLKWEYIQTI
jgi:hypothetical protein